MKNLSLIIFISFAILLLVFGISFFIKPSSNQKKAEAFVIKESILKDENVQNDSNSIEIRYDYTFQKIPKTQLF